MAVLLAAAPATASIVLVARSDDGILIAADTRGNSTNPEIKPFPYCKVVASEEAVIAFVGLNAIPSLELDLREPLARVLAQELPFPELLEALDRELEAFLPVMLDAAVRFVPRFTPILERRRGFFLGMVVAGVHEGQPIWRVREYVRRERGGTVRIKHKDSVCGENCLPGDRTALDARGRVGREFRRLELAKLQRNWPREARRLIGLAAQQSPSIALPAVSLAVTPRGVTWLEAHPVCGSAPGADHIERTP